ncbi:Protein ytfJ precursor [Cronobacter turicensis 564]|nr:Protein ytfJ precursor [Cronobacter turicensis 564]
MRRSLESTKKEYPSSIFVLDGTGAVQRAWRLQPGGSAVVVLDKDGRIRFAKDGALTADEVRQVMTLLRSLLT